MTEPLTTSPPSVGMSPEQRFMIRSIADERAGREPYEVVGPCLYRRTKSCRELYPDNPDMQCQYCLGNAKPVSAVASPVTCWREIETLPEETKERGYTILRPHKVWGAMDVKYQPTETSVGVLPWINGDFTTAWPEDAFLPFWMPRPDQPLSLTSDRTEGS